MNRVEAALLEKYFPLRRAHIEPGAHRLSCLMQEPEGRAALEVPCILVVGTNGKGSVVRLLEMELLHQGLKVGSYTSPHFIDPLERIRLCGNSALPKDVAAAQETIEAWAASHLPNASFFEITTAIALLVFLRRGVDLTVIEAGLGGRLDSTNALAPLVTVLTSVGLDHTDRLGNSLEKIAWEKAMASRRGRCLVCGPLDPEAEQGVLRATKTTGARILNGQQQVDTRDPTQPTKRVINQHTAVAALTELKKVFHTKPLSNKTPQEPQTSVLQRMSQVHLPGRFDVRNRDQTHFIFDTAHNPAAAESLLQSYEASRFGTKKCLLLFAALKDKDYRTCLETLSPIVHHVFLAPLPHDNSWDVLSLQRVAAELGLSHTTCNDIEAACHQAQSFKPSRPVLVTGSFAFVGAVMKELRIHPEQATTTQQKADAD